MRAGEIEKIKEYFAKNKAVVLVYLYGSYATDEAKKDSDIDLAVLVDEKMGDAFDIQLQAIGELSSLLKKEVEVQNLNICKTTFAYRVLYEGKIIYQRSEKERVDFEFKLMRDYFDMRPFLAEYSKRIASLAREGKIGARPFTY